MILFGEEHLLSKKGVKKTLGILTGFVFVDFYDLSVKGMYMGVMLSKRLYMIMNPGQGFY